MSPFDALAELTRELERRMTPAQAVAFLVAVREDLADAVRNLLPSERRAEYVPFDADCRGAMVLFRNED